MHLLRSNVLLARVLISLSLATLLTGTIVYADPLKPMADQEMQNFDWVIYVKDSQLMKGPLKEPISIDLEAVNTSGAIHGDYTGSATMIFGKDLGEVSAQVVSTSTKLKFRLTPSQPRGSNPSASDTQPEYTGKGEMVMVTVSTGTVGGQSSSRSFSTKRPISVTVNKTAVELVVTYPKGTVTYHGYIIGEGKGTHQAKMEKKKQEKAKQAKTKSKKPKNEPPELAPLKPIPDENPQLAPLKPVKAEDPELAPLTPVKEGEE